MNKFEKVSLEQYLNSQPERSISVAEELANLKLPKRATKFSAGYDFYAPFDFTLKAGETIKIPTGIKVQIDENSFLGIFPKSGLGFKYRLQLDNCIGIVDCDYFDNQSNEGHIFAKITNDSRENKTLVVKKGEPFVQGIFIQYGITVDDFVEDERIGGFGSTNK